MRLFNRLFNRIFGTRDKKEYICPVLNARFVLIPAGTFMMGSPDEEPGRSDNETLHQITISTPFYLQTTLVTQGQWEKVMGNSPLFHKGDDNLPVAQVSWDEVQDFIGRLNRQEGTGKYRLPTEAEWEYACRAGSTTAYCFGEGGGDEDDDSVDEHLGDYAWYDHNSEGGTHPVGQKKPNAWGLYDIHGNVMELVNDYCGNYPSGHVADPTGPTAGSDSVSRGGSWLDSAEGCRSANRYSIGPGDRGGDLGFRLLAMAKRPSQTTAGDIGRNDRFIAYHNGTVLDASTNLLWATNDNGSNINWANAESYCEDYRGGGYTDWRMPTLDELEGLYDKVKIYKSICGSDVHLTELIRLTCYWMWASETRGSEAAIFGFNDGGRYWYQQSDNDGNRALPVRSGK